VEEEEEMKRWGERLRGEGEEGCPRLLQWLQYGS